MNTCNIKINNLNVTVNGRNILAIPQLELSGGIHGIIGPNGSGKTTLLRTLAGINRYKGNIRVCGKTPLEARSITGYMPALPLVDLLAKALDVIHAGSYGAIKTVETGEIIKILGITHLVNRRFHSLSGGEKRLVCFARVLARDPRVLLLDEPLSFLDLRNVGKIVRLLRSYVRNGRIVLVTSHELQYLSIFDTVTLLENGHLAYHGSSSNLPLNLLEKVYGTRLAEAWIGGNRIILPREIFRDKESLYSTEG